MNNRKTLILGKAHSIIVEDISNARISVFHNIYLQAIDKIRDIVLNSELSYEEEKNNIIAFVGDRGTGKSSVMKSFCNLITPINNTTEVDSLEESSISIKLKEIQNVNFIILDNIDPSKIETNCSILEVIISQLYSNFDIKIQKERIKEREKAENLAKRFQEVFDCLKYIKMDNKDKYSIDSYDLSLEVLNKLATGTRMKQKMDKLIEGYINFFAVPQKKNILMILIDDLDMNMKHATDMTEQIRKYLMTPNVVITMALKWDQFYNSTKQMFYLERETLFRGMDNVEKEILHNEIEDMTEKYLEKFIPISRRLYLPEVQDIYNGVEFNFQLEENGRLYEHNKLQNELLRIIYEKTKLIFIYEKESLHKLIPNNLRKLQDFYNFIISMKDFDAGQNGSQILKNNLDSFEEYFFNQWCRENLTSRTYELVKSTKNIGKKNLNKFFSYELGKILADKNLICEEDTIILCNPKNNPELISFGDILIVIDECSRYEIDKELTMLIQALKIFYTIRFTKMINLEEKGNENIKKIVAGNYFAPSNSKYIRNMRDRYEIKQIFDEKELNIFNKPLIYWLEFLNGSKDTKGIDEENLRKIEAISKMLYFVSFGERNNSKIQLKNYEPSYMKDFGIGSGSKISGVGRKSTLNFDIFNVIYNSLSIEQEWERRYGEKWQENTTEFIKEIFYKDKKLYNHKEFILPIQSVEFTEKLSNNLCRYISSRGYKEKFEGVEYRYYTLFFEYLNICVKDIIEENGQFLKATNIEKNFEKYLIYISESDEYFGKVVNSLYESYLKQKNDKNTTSTKYQNKLSNNLLKTHNDKELKELKKKIMSLNTNERTKKSIVLYCKVVKELLPNSIEEIEKFLVEISLYKLSEKVPSYKNLDLMKIFNKYYEEYFING